MKTEKQGAASSWGPLLPRVYFSAHSPHASAVYYPLVYHEPRSERFLEQIRSGRAVEFLGFAPPRVLLATRRCKTFGDRPDGQCAGRDRRPHSHNDGLFSARRSPGASSSIEAEL